MNQKQNLDSNMFGSGNPGCPSEKDKRAGLLPVAR